MVAVDLLTPASSRLCVIINSRGLSSILAVDNSFTLDARTCVSPPATAVTPGCLHSSTSLPVSFVFPRHAFRRTPDFGFARFSPSVL
ncbi:hypothetical protein J6590_011446 [Homalodisca vitripennis]|nr:hypothetical protein J6590_011446 [Homalodisca vitripennis]